MEKEIKEIKQELVVLSEQMNKLTIAMIGDKLERRVGYLDQIDSNIINIQKNKDDIENIKKKVKTPWGKIGIASGAGVGMGGIGATKGSVLLNKIIEFFV